MQSTLLLYLAAAAPWLAASQAVVTPASASANLGAEQPARVELLEGRASLAMAGGVVELARGERDLQVDGEAYLELRPGSRVALRWNATASLIVHGPAVLEWGPLDDAPALFEWRFAQLEQVHLEVRRGPVRMTFPGGWSGTVESGAGFVRGLPGGGVEWHHDAGLPILLAAPHEPGHVRPPWVVLAGAWLRLPPGRTFPEMLHGSGARLLDPYARQGSGPAGRNMHPAWSGFAWPWEEPPVSAVLVTRLEPPTEAAGGRPTEPAVPVRQPVPEGIFIGSPATPEGPVETLPPAGGSATQVPGSGPSGSSGTGADGPQPPAREPSRPFVDGGTLRLTPWGVRRFRDPG